MHPNHPQRIRTMHIGFIGIGNMGGEMAQHRLATDIVAALHHKDIGVALDIAHETGLPLPLPVMQQLNALGSGFGEQDTSSLLLVLEQMMGRKPGGN
jgi:3-hydroxyisobutyrate dehydrogenase-like beta-hydroxyacid dehydrogenase